jgi:hypothetical protein
MGFFIRLGAMRVSMVLKCTGLADGKGPTFRASRSASVTAILLPAAELQHMITTTADSMDRSLDSHMTLAVLQQSGCRLEQVADLLQQEAPLPPQGHKEVGILRLHRPSNQLRFHRLSSGILG